MLAPVINQEQLLLSDKINGYNVIADNTYSDSDQTYIYKLSSSNKTYINSNSIVYVFDTFYLDWDNSSIITSDTITHILN